MVKVREGLPLIDGQTTNEDSASLAAQMVAQHQHGFYRPEFPTFNLLNDDLKKQLASSKLSAAMDSSLHPDTAAILFNLDTNDLSIEDLTSSADTKTQPLQPNTQQVSVNNNDTTNHAVAKSVPETKVSTASGDESKQNYTDERNPRKPLPDDTIIDLPAWLKTVANRVNLPSLPDLEKACALIMAESSLNLEENRSSAYMTGIGMTDILTYLFQDEDALTAAMLYRAARTKLLSNEQIQEVFGEEVAKLVRDSLALGRLSETIENNKRLEDYVANNQREQLSNIYSMLISMTNDVRAVLIKLAERTFAMRELSYSTKERQQRVAREVMTIYAPLAHRLGIAQIKWELEDLAFRYLAPEAYKEIAKLLAEKRSEREAYIERVQKQLENALAEANIKAEVSGRVKHIYSIYRKMKLKGLTFDQLYDIRALRVLVDSQAECYHTLGLVHGLWKHIPDQFDDYITNPKANGYRSLHTAVIAENKSLEIQIRTHKMHFEAELGMCAHVNYKEGGKNKKDSSLNQKISSLRQLLAAGNEPKVELVDKQNILPSETLEEANSDIDDDSLEDFKELEHIYVFSRDGDITELPKGATVLDFAYYVHTQVGNRAQAARVNQRYVPLTYQLKTGEQVEIITKSSREPNRDWLVPSLGYIYTNRARSKLRQWFNKQDRDKNIEIGKQMLAKELARLALQPSNVNLKDYRQFFNVKSTDDILVGLVTGEIGLHQLTGHIAKQLNIAPDPDEPITDITPPIQHKAGNKNNNHQIYVEGLDNIEFRFANCCQPIYGEPIAGFITQSNGVSIHNRGCAEYLRLIEREPERQISASWISQKDTFQPVDILIEAYDRRGLLHDLTKVIDKEKINIRGVGTHTDTDNVAHLKFSLEVNGLSQLSKLLAKIEQQPGILHARRAV